MYQPKRTLMEVFFEATQKNDLTSIQTCLLYSQIYKNINHQTPKDGFSALLWAAYHGHESAVAILLDHGANIDIEDNGKFAPLHYAAIANHKSVIELLLKRGAKINITNDVGRTPLHWASFFMREEAIQMLLQGGADVSIQDKDGLDALQLVPLSRRRHFARFFQEYEEVKLTSTASLGEDEKVTAVLPISSLKDEEDVVEVKEVINVGATGLKRKRFSQHSQGSHLLASTNAVHEVYEATSPFEQQSWTSNSTLKVSSSPSCRTGLTMKNRIMTLASMLRIRLPQINEESDFRRENYYPQHFHNDHLISFDDRESDYNRYEQYVLTLEKKLNRRTRMRSVKERIEWIEEELGASLKE